MTRSKRKWEHIKYALLEPEKNSHGFNDITFIHQSLPDLALEDVNLNHKIGELVLSSPIFINAMTGGGGTRTKDINSQLAIIAREAGLAMAVGSQMAALKDSAERESYEIVRKENPDGIIIANLGSEATVAQAQNAIDMIQANAIQIHLNVVQEITMPEGDRDFTGALLRIEKIVKEVGVPVIIKEVGFGLSMETVKKLQSVGVCIVDIGGYGGTNFASIENGRRTESLSFFNDWGIPTAVSIAETKAAAPAMSIIATGGINSSLNVMKSLALGADTVGMAGFFLKQLIENGMDASIQTTKVLHDEIRYMMLALGKRTIKEIQTTPIMISGSTHHWLNERGINTKSYSQRS
jgi:isopentenyl-diphosphate Delta-isomerase